MEPLTNDDLIPLAEYCSRRAEFLEAHRRYTDTYRRIRVAPGIAVLFENRQTLCFRIQEMIRAARLEDPIMVQHQLALYNLLLPPVNHLQAAIVVDSQVSPVPSIKGAALELGETTIPARLITSRPVDRAAGMAQWLSFAVFSAERGILADLRRTVRVEVQFSPKGHAGADLTPEQRESLLDDLRSYERIAS